MGWVTMANRNPELRADINNTQGEILQLSRQKRTFEKSSKAEENIFNRQKTRALREIKEPLDAIRQRKPGLDSRRDSNGVETEEYKKWTEEYEEAKEKYDAEKVDINEQYDDIFNEHEEESTDETTRIDTEKDELQAILEDEKQEQQAVSEGVSGDIQTTGIGKL